MTVVEADFPKESVTARVAVLLTLPPGIVSRPTNAPLPSTVQETPVEGVPPKEMSAGLMVAYGVKFVPLTVRSPPARTGVGVNESCGGGGGAARTASGADAFLPAASTAVTT